VTYHLRRLSTRWAPLARDPCSGCRQRQSDGCPGDHFKHHPVQHAEHQAWSGRAKCGSNREFCAPLRNRVAQNAVHANCRKAQGQRRETKRQNRDEALAHQGGIDLILDASDVRDQRLRVNFVHFLRDSLRQKGPRPIRYDGQGDSRDPVQGLPEWCERKPRSRLPYAEVLVVFDHADHFVVV
jgi:hypothetical protein